MKRRAFTIVELLVVIGIIATLMGLLMPSLTRSRERARLIACQANLHQIGIAIAAYAAENHGVIVPEAWDFHMRLSWVEPLFPQPEKSGILHCPVDDPPIELTSYCMNDYLQGRKFGFGRQTTGMSLSSIVLMGERRFDFAGLWGGRIHPDFGPTFDPAKHGPRLGSNYLYADMHVDNTPPPARDDGRSPWDPRL